MFEVFTMVGASFTLIMLLMLILWGIYLFQRNASIMDIGWGVGFLITAWTYFFLGNGDLFKMITVTTMATIWAVRLIIHLYLRYSAHQEDQRYTKMRQQGEDDPNDRLFLMKFIIQGTLIIFISLPFFIVDFGSRSEWTNWEFSGIGVWLVGVLGETFADAQLIQFNKNPENLGKVCRIGWWRFSRHPNYFFEFLVWGGFFLFAFNSYAGILALISPLIVLLLSLKSYRDYQNITSAFIPWFSRK